MKMLKKFKIYFTKLPLTPTKHSLLLKAFLNLRLLSFFLMTITKQHQLHFFHLFRDTQKSGAKVKFFFFFPLSTFLFCWRAQKQFLFSLFILKIWRKKKKRPQEEILKINFFGFQG